MPTLESQARRQKAVVTRLEVVIEIPKWSFVKRGNSEQVDFISPLPCPYNYGAAPAYVGLEGDLLDAVVLGPRMPRGTRVEVIARGAIGLSDRGWYDDKLVCSEQPLNPSQREALLRFFRLYGWGKRILNLTRGRPGLTRCEGWGSAEAAIRRARPRDDHWYGPHVPF